jgi:hypothetical protein
VVVDIDFGKQPAKPIVQQTEKFIYFHGAMIKTLSSSAAWPRYAKPHDSEIVFKSE